jgi:galactokinase
MAAATAKEVPETKSLADIYPDDALKSQTSRWNRLLKAFKDSYGKPADFVSRSPGRVNIIGEVGVVACRKARE